MAQLPVLASAGLKFERPRKNLQKICGFSLTHSPTRLVYKSREQRTSPCVELVFFEAQGRADFGQIDDEVGLCLVPKTKYDL
jgi:hypothetical protein